MRSNVRGAVGASTSPGMRSRGTRFIWSPTIRASPAPEGGGLRNPGRNPVQSYASGQRNCDFARPSQSSFLRAVGNIQDVVLAHRNVLGLKRQYFPEVNGDMNALSGIGVLPEDERFIRLCRRHPTSGKRYELEDGHPLSVA